MQVLHWSEMAADAQRAALARPAVDGDNDVAAQAAAIIADVRRRGDAALFDYTRRFDGVALESLRVGDEEYERAEAQLPAAQRTALCRAIDNVRRFHAAGSVPALSIETEPGVRCERVPRPISSVGLYVPAGSAPLPSAAIMLAVPAGLAGCAQRVMCTPPTAEGRAHPAVTYVAKCCGLREIYKVGGAQAVAAMAYGTATVPKVQKIFGPGNAWVTAAKQLVAADPHGAALDLPAGPSEVMVLADAHANPAYVAADLLAQCEHDPSSQAILLSTCASLAERVRAAVLLQLAALSRQHVLNQSVRALRLIVVPDLATAVAIANDYAPEHLLLQVEAARELLASIDAAGSVFIGRWTPEPMGDYCSGTNHVLPTYGHARACSGLSTLDFQRRMTVQELTADGLRSLGPTAIVLAGLEGLDAHAAAVRLRLDELAAPGSTT